MKSVPLAIDPLAMQVVFLCGIHFKVIKGSLVSKFQSSLIKGETKKKIAQKRLKCPRDLENRVCAFTNILTTIFFLSTPRVNRRIGAWPNGRPPHASWMAPSVENLTLHWGATNEFRETNILPFLSVCSFHLNETRGMSTKANQKLRYLRW